MSTSTVPKAKAAVAKAKAALENRIALVSEVARQQEKIEKLEGQLAAEHEAYQAAYEAALGAWSKRELDAFDLRAPRRASIKAASKATGRKASRKNSASAASGAPRSADSA